MDISNSLFSILPFSSPHSPCLETPGTHFLRVKSCANRGQQCAAVGPEAALSGILLTKRTLCDSPVQIRIPPNLADVLKAYTKEIIRQQPDDILAFSAVYFSNLAAASKALKDFRAPEPEQVKALRAALGDGNEPVSRKDLLERATALQIDEGTMTKARPYVAIHQS